MENNGDPISIVYIFYLLNYFSTLKDAYLY